jgi:gamma-butyrobetaine dioxygenase
MSHVTSSTIGPLPFPAIWLRDNCPCEHCRDPRNGQKMFAITDLPADLSVANTELDGDTFTVSFAPDGHRSVFSRAWLDSLPRSTYAGRTEQGKALWSAETLGALPEIDWVAYAEDRLLRAAGLRHVQKTGFLLVRNVPVEDAAVVHVAELFGFVRQTNDGRLFDVRVEATPINLAFTGMAIGPHTDNPYRDPVPTLQLLHCLENAVEGGETSLVDGFFAASLLRADHPQEFELLTRTPVQFAFSSTNVMLRAEQPLIETDGVGRIRGIRFNNRSMQPLMLPFGDVDDFYLAYRRFAEYLNRPSLPARFRLDPGDCLIFDNTRILHARTAFDDGGRRQLQGCYADLDALASMTDLVEEL